MADVFLSYKSEDRALVAALAHGLEREGLSVWWDRKIVAGGAWRAAIMREIRKARVVIAVWSRRTEDVNAASWMLNEIDEAARLGIPIIPVLIEPCVAPFGFRHLQAADLSDWRGRGDHPEWREVLGGVRAALGRVGGGPIRPAPGRAQATSRKPSAAPVLFSAALLAAVFIGWREFADAPQTAAPAPAPEAAASAAPAPPTEARRDWDVRVAPSADGQVQIVRFEGADGVRGVFRRTRNGDWVERNSEAGFAGAYHVNRESADMIVLHDGNRELHVRIDLKRGVVAIRDRGAPDYQDRYRILAAGGEEP